jgi:hypothetical protein
MKILIVHNRYWPKSASSSATVRNSPAGRRCGVAG